MDGSEIVLERADQYKNIDIMCSQCKIKPSEVGVVADAIMCNKCKDMNLPEKNPYNSFTKSPFHIANVENNDLFLERINYLNEVNK